VTAGLPLLTLLILCPVAGLAAILLIPGRYPGAIRLAAALSGVAACVVTALIALGFAPHADGYQFVEFGKWIPGAAIEWHVGVDGISLPLVLLTSIVYLTGVLVMWELQDRVKEFYAFMALLVTGVFGVFVSLDLFFFLFFYEVAVLPMYLLIAVWGSTRKEYGAMKLTLYLLAGTALVVPAVLALYAGSSPHTFNIILLAHGGFSPQFQRIVFPFLFIGFGILAGMWPLHTWSPVGHVAAPTAVSMLHAGVLMKLGAYGILRVAMTILPAGAHYWAPWAAGFATVNIVYGAFVAMAQTDLKFVIGYSSVSHMGIVLLGLATLSVDGINGAVLQMFSHGIMTALFFAAVGYIYDRYHTREIAKLGGLSKAIPVASAFFIIAALTGAGVPGFASFWAEFLVFLGTLRTYPLLAAITVGGLIITLAYSIRVIVLAFFGEAREAHPGVADIGAFLAFPRLVLVVTLVVLGFYPRLLLDVIDPATRALVAALR
jgi:NADH-quinone oxidoreductase subunit M